MTTTGQDEKGEKGFSQVQEPQPGPEPLRRRAEKKVGKRGIEDLEALAPDAVKQIAHELQVHQIELEMQNEELRQAQNELAASRERYFDLYALAPIGHLTISEKGLILEANLTAAALLETDRKSLLKRPFSKFIHPEDQDVLYLHYDRLLITGQPQRYELRMVTKAGETLWVRLEWAVISEDREEISVAIINISDRKQSEEKLRKNEERSRLLADITARLLASRKPRGIIEELGQKVMVHLDCQVFLNFLVDERAGRLHLNAYGGITAGEARNLEWLDYGGSVCGWVAEKKESLIVEDLFNVPDPRAERIKPFGLQAYCCQPLIIQNDLIGVLSFGTKTRARFLEEEVDLMRTFADEIAVALDRVILIKRIREARDSLDLQVRERTAELNETVLKLERKNRELQEFILFASHDLRDPLRKIKTFCDRIEKMEGSSLDETGQDYLQRVIRAADFMHRLLDSMLDLAKIAANPGSFKQINLTKVAGEAVEVFEGNMRKTGARVEVENLPTLAADETQMMQLFQNLIGNALKFRGEEAPRIRITAMAVGPEEYEIVVRDNGVGFDLDLARVIFKPFGRLKGGTRRESTGLGLAICYRIVERHGGTIRAESEPGKGTAFIIRLPKKQRRSDEK